MFTVFTFHPLRVLVDTDTGEVVAVQDVLTGCAASLIHSRKAIADATARAHLAWASITEPV